ncbi:endo-1,4-beta-xylanase B [Podospora conica]|nr:endo-1,4-beta-xylanase B [Schizothecium conicum]
MVKISSFLSGLAVPGTLAAVVGPQHNDEPEVMAMERRQGASYFQNWSEGNSNIRCQQRGNGFSANWNSKGGFVCGLGWRGSGSRVIKYSGTYEAKGPGYLAVYGWTKNPLIEYYILDSYAELAPNEPWTKKGNFTIDGEGTFTIYTSQRVNKPSIEGTRTFMQYWSVRTEKRVGGTISTQKHFNEWKKYNMNLGNHDYVVLAVEGYTATGGPGSSGSSTLNLS